MHRNSTLDADANVVLSSAAADAELAREGIAAVPVLDSHECCRLAEAYWGMVPAGEGGIQLDFLRDDPALKRRLHAVVAPALDRALGPILPNHYAVYSSYVVKYPGPDSALFLHRDMAVDDERVRTAYAFWMPLVDVGPEFDNGPVAFIPGSQFIRGGQCGPTTVMQFQPFADHLSTFLQPRSVDGGTALVYDARMLHASSPNRSGRPRLAIGGLLARRDVPIVQVLATGRRHRLVTKVDSDYFLDHTPIEIEMEGMPERFPVIDEYDENPVTATADFLGDALAPATATRSVLVPPDVPFVDRDRPLTTEPGYWRPTHDRDVALSAANLRPPGEIALPTTGVSGGVGSSPIVRHGDLVGSLPPTLPDVTALLGPSVVDADVVVLDQEGRLTFTAPAGVRKADVIVIECPPVRSGAAAAGSIAELDLGQRLLVRPGVSLMVWNGGPGPVVLLARRHSGGAVAWWRSIRLGVPPGRSSNE